MMNLDKIKALINPFSNDTVIDIPDFLLEMSRQMREQDNRITAEPIWQVRHKQSLVTEAGYNESHVEVFNPDSEGRPVFSTKADFDNKPGVEVLLDSEPRWCKLWCEENGLDKLDKYVEFFQDEFCFEVLDPDFLDLPPGWRVLHMQEIEVVVKSCLTEHDANYFIQRKQHDYPKLYTYVESMTYCPQMIELRNWILSLTAEK